MQGLYSISYYEKEIGYLRLRAFNENSSDQLKKEISKLEKKENLLGYIFDLRNNPGGLLSQAIKISENKEISDINKKIDSLVALYLGKVDKRQGITRNPEVTVMQRIGLANQYVSGSQQGLTATEEQLISQAKAQLNEALLETNKFFSEEWSDFKSKLETLELNPFKTTTTFKTVN